MSRRYCQFCGEDFSQFTDDGETVCGVRAQGLFPCCNKQVSLYIARHGKFSYKTKKALSVAYGVWPSVEALLWQAEAPSPE